MTSLLKALPAYCLPVFDWFKTPIYDSKYCAPAKNSAPDIKSPACFSIAENTKAVGTVKATDKDGDTIKYSITGGADAALFTIDSKTGALSFKTAPDFEAPKDKGGNNVYDIVVTASDGKASDCQAIKITVTDVKEYSNRAPAFTGGNAFTINENTTAVATIAASDPDGDRLTFSLAGGADAALFTIDAATGKLAFKAAPDFENPGDAGRDNVYDVTVKVSDGKLSATKAIKVKVADVDENRAPVLTGPAKFTVNENTTSVGIIAASDADGDTLTFSLAGGADAGLFNIDAATGALSFKAAPDFETPLDAGANNVYDVIVKVSDGKVSATKALQVTVADVDENRAPTFTGGNTFTIDENTTAVGIIAANDPDGDTLTFSLAGGADAALFDIDPATGALSFKTAPDFEAPADAGANNVYDVIVQVTDGKASVTQAVQVTVADVNENRAPVLTGPTTFSIPENGIEVGQIFATDEDGDQIQFAITGGDDAGLFTIDPITGVISFIDPPDFEFPRDAGADNIYDLIVSASDGTASTEGAITVTVTDVAEGFNRPPFISGATDFLVDENTTLVTAIAASDPDGDAVRYLIIGGDDADFFDIDPDTGILSFKVAPDFETPLDVGADNVYNLTVAVTDGKATTAEEITVTVQDVIEAVNAAPRIVGFLDFSISTAIKAVDISIQPARAPVNNSETGLIGQVLATDADGDTLHFTIGGEDAARFAIDSDGMITIDAPLLAFGSIDGDNDFEFSVIVDDGNGGSDSLAIAYFVVSVG